MFGIGGHAMFDPGNRNRLPLRHLSIRVPWHDNGWNGTVCKRPVENAACLVLKRIRETRDDAAETANAERHFSEFEDRNFPACLPERGGFMSEFEYTRFLEHPYKWSAAHSHFAETPFRYPAYSAACIPFRWTLREGAEKVDKGYGIGLQWELEDRADDLMGFSADWLQDKQNQLAMLDTFFSAIEPERSLCFFYAKQTPLSEDPRRVLIGVGRVTGVGQSVEYAYDSPGELRSVIWERPVNHSVRPGFVDGFLLPYHQILELAARKPDLDPEQYVAYAPEESRNEFSYGSEHVSHDTAISSLLACADALRAAQEHVQGDWETPLQWIDARLNELWEMRGPCPGLGAALTAFGVQQGNFLAYDIASELEDNEDPWPLVEQAFENPELLNMGLGKRISKTLVKTWKTMPEESRALLKLLSRFNLTIEQATRFFEETEREEVLNSVESDAELLANPYRLYELDRFSPDPIALTTIDLGVFSDMTIREAHPLPEPSTLNDDPVEARRVRAFVVSVLEEASSEGSTLLPQDDVIRTIRSMPLQPSCPVSRHVMRVVEEEFSPVIERVEMADGAPAYQLSRLSKIGQIIRREVERRIQGKPHDIEADWLRLLKEKLGDPDTEAEQRAREEKNAALKELAASRVAVLIGPAGTGKTTLLSVLCELPRIRDGGITLLAPTGKARVQLEQSTTGLAPQTIAQFLLKLDRYHPDTGLYGLSDKERVEVGRTIIIDEASMVTEEQLGAVLDAVRGVERFILVGDHRQLPPIGSGRPFVDIVARLKPEAVEGKFPRVGPRYAELTIRHRQRGEARDDLLLAEWFSGQAPGAGADEIWNKVEAGTDTNTLGFASWDDADDLHNKILDVLAEELDLDSQDDTAKFEQSIGGTEPDDNGYVYFNRSSGAPGAASRVEDWQVLTPVRGQPHGVRDLNRVIQQHYRRGTLNWASSRQRRRRIPKPIGPEHIVYGDKVINTKNTPFNTPFNFEHVYPQKGALSYVANGEIGTVVGTFMSKKMLKLPKYVRQKLLGILKVEFSSQQGYTYDFYSEEFGEDADLKLELAYAITIHKAQGSEFDTTFLIIPTPTRMLSPELLYTALTRQRDRVVVLHQGNLSELKRYASSKYSEIAHRLTNLFSAPKLVKVDEERFLENKLIHHTRRGDTVESKSEVIIADLLYSKGIEDYLYGAKLVAPDGTFRYPDFTIDDAATGQRVYWEHLGMLHDPDYRARWETKLKWYKAQDILPYDDGGGSGGTLLTTRDDEQGGIDSEQLEQVVDEVFGL
jgi:ATP-dependent exoDNAse (exonuclease V) alpha subunit